ncbi:MAG: hypothetical protein C3F14_02355 [Deltaproteobacteria bacterium]|nr:MAG: hypothetical protein C3F14_02355 [Deltaproteobacteria bacterium]
MSEPTASVEVKEDLSDCPRCGGGRGFHVSFRRRGGSLAVILVCPSCGHRFTVGEWTIPAGEPRPFDPAIDAGP